MWAYISASTGHSEPAIGTGLQAFAALGACLISSRLAPGGLTRGLVAAAAVFGAGWLASGSDAYQRGP
jgi:hypothetical protein